MKSLKALLAAFALSTLPTLSELVEDPETGLRTGTIIVADRSGRVPVFPDWWPVGTFTIGPDANLSGAYLGGANLMDADLRGANLRGANLHGTNLMDADLTGADLSEAFLNYADLSGANLTDANLSEAFLDDASFSGADLTNTDFNEARTLVGEPGDARFGATRPIFSVITAVSRTLYEDIQALQNSQVLAGGISPEQAAAIEANSAKVGITAEQATSIQFNTNEISELKTTMEAFSVQLAQLNTQIGDLQGAVAQRDATIENLQGDLATAIAERDARFTEDQIHAMSADYTIGLNEAGNVQMKINFFESSDLTTFAPFTVAPESISVVDGKICLEFTPNDAAFFRFSLR